MFTFDHFWAGFLTVSSIVLGWLHIGHRREMDELKKLAAETSTSLSKHQLYAAETYARKPDVEHTMEQSERRIMERLDEIRDDIKSLKSPPQH